MEYSRGKNLLMIATVLAPILVAVPSASAEDIVIGTGSPAGVYHKAGRLICHMLNKTGPDEEGDCLPLSTAGSTFNLQAIRSKDLPIAIVQSDRHHDAVEGLRDFSAAGPDEGLRSLFSMHVEPFTLIVRNDSGIRSIGDLHGRRVNIGPPGSGHRATMERVMQRMGWTRDDFALSEELAPSEQALALCHDQVDAIVYTVGHPNRASEQATRLCAARLVSVEGSPIDALVSSEPYYRKTEIPAHIYLTNPEVTQSFGPIATVVASEEVDEETVYRIVSSVFDNIDAMRKAHPAFQRLDVEQMVRDGLFAPLHPGAERYFREKGLL